MNARQRRTVRRASDRILRVLANCHPDYPARWGYRHEPPRDWLKRHSHDEEIARLREVTRLRAQRLQRGVLERTRRALGRWVAWSEYKPVVVQSLTIGDLELLFRPVPWQMMGAPRHAIVLGAGQYISGAIELDARSAGPVMFRLRWRVGDLQVWETVVDEIVPGGAAVFGGPAPYTGLLTDVHAECWAAKPWDVHLQRYLAVAT